jgi:hypothetical protein
MKALSRSINTKSTEKSPYKIKEAAISERSASFHIFNLFNPCRRISTSGRNIRINENELNDMVYILMPLF